MIPDLKPYPAMKDSGVEWLGEVPEHWDVLPNRAFFAEVKERGHPAEQMLSVTITKGVIPQRTLLADSSKKDSSNQDKSAYKLVLPSDIAYNKMRAWQGAVGVSDYQGIVSPAYVVERPRAGANSRYLHYLLRTPAFAKEAERWSYGITSDMWSLRPEHLKMIYGCLPPLPEQAAIVRFLDHADRRIRRYIHAKQKLIKLLEEQKQVLIHQSVTRGLDPNVHLKPSGVEWLGDVPKHWKILPLKRWVSTKITDGPHETPALLDDGIPFMSAESMVGGRLDFSRRRGFISREQHEIYCRKCRPRRDDIFMCKSGATTGKVAIVETADEFSVWSPLALIRVESHKVLARLLFAVLQTRYVQRQVQDTWSYGTQPNLAMRAMERLVVVLPPIDEQQEVLAHLDRTTKKPSEAIDRAHREISLLREYRTRLIADVVTGKLDVRSAARRLPDEIKEPEPFDETGALIDGEEEPSDGLDTAPEEAAV